MNAISPQGLGTAEVEGLGSYAQRFAAANGTYPGQLVFRYLAWMDRGLIQRTGAWSTRPGRVRVGFNINSFELADVWLRLLQRATGRADLLTLTTRVWDSVFPTRDFQTATQEWCPFCLQEDRVPYYRLRWTLRYGRVCRRHRRYLQRRCAQCGKAPPVLHDRSFVGMCPWCAGDLRIPASTEADAEPTDFEYWASLEVELVLEISASCHREVTWHPQRALRLLARAHKIRTAGAFARQVGAAKLTVWYWFNTRTRPSLGAILRIYFHFGVSLANHLFSATPDKLPARQVGAVQREFLLRGRRGPRKLDWASIKKSLRAELARPVAEAQSFIAVARQLRIARRTLRAHAAPLCRAISRRRCERQKIERERREKDLVIAMVAVLRKFRAAGLVPTWRQLECAMRRPGLLNSRYARRALRLACEPAAWRALQL